MRTLVVADKRRVGEKQRLVFVPGSKCGTPGWIQLRIYSVLHYHGAWLLTGPIFHWSDTWQLIINTLTNIVSMLMLFLIQNTQNREMTAAQLKLDELIRSVQGAHNVFLNLEDLAEEDLERIRERYSELALRARQRAQLGHKDTGTPTVEIQLPEGLQ